MPLSSGKTARFQHFRHRDLRIDPIDFSPPKPHPDQDRYFGTMSWKEVITPENGPWNPVCTRGNNVTDRSVFERDCCFCVLDYDDKIYPYCSDRLLYGMAHHEDLKFDDSESNLYLSYHHQVLEERSAKQSFTTRHESFLLGDGEEKVTVEQETRVPNAAIFHFKKEDHTLANLIRDKLLRNHAVTFAAYKVPHPLFPDVDVRVQTDGSIDPKEALTKACRDLISDLNAVKQEFTKEFELNKIANEGLNEQPNGQQNGQPNGQDGQYGYGYGASQRMDQAQGMLGGMMQGGAQGYPNGASGQGYSYGYQNGQGPNGAGY